ncbi:MAG: hypothetical protein KDA47_10565 [Planctomycetales bacterium]|nr:hypothetical protein [Planctomycetales bacterium]
MASAVSVLDEVDRDDLYEKLLTVARRKTAEADTKLDDRGRKVDEDNEDYGGSVIIVNHDED